MRKGGISTIVVTVLIILITTAAVAIIWSSIIPLIMKNLKFAETDTRLDIVTTEGYTIYDSAQKIVLIQVKRSSEDKVTMNQIKIILYFKGNSYSEIVDAPGPNQARTYAFNLTSNILAYGEPESVSVAPIFTQGGSSNEGIASPKVKFLSGKVSIIPESLHDTFGGKQCLDDLSCNDENSYRCVETERIP